MIQARFPDVKAIPNQTYVLDVKDVCVDCLNKKAVSDAKKEKRDQKKAEFNAKRAEERQEKLSNLKLFVL